MFRIIVPVYNSESWIVKCLESIIKQDFKDWQAVVIDDNSSDMTLEKIKEVIKQNNMSDHFKVLKRTSNVGALENIVSGIKTICKDDDDIIITVDGDDWLKGTDVLTYLNEVYNKDKVWMTYGSFESESGLHNNFCKQIKSVDTYRNQSWCTSHLRTFKYWLWKKVREDDLKNKVGQYYSMAWDMAIMYPLIEMSGLEKIKYIEKILYIYNDSHPMNDFRKNPMAQLAMATEIKNKHPYNKIGMDWNKI